MSRGRVTPKPSIIGFTLFLCAGLWTVHAQTTDPEKLVTEADRLAWLRVWAPAEPLYAQAREEFARAGDKRNALYAEVNHLRTQLPRLSVPEVSERLSEYLDDSLVLADERLRLRVLIIKGETDVDLDPSLSQRSWNEALAIAQRLGEAGWANRARGELGLVAFLQGDTNTAVVNLGQALKVAETTADTSSLVRWLTLFGHGYVELGRPEQALDFYERALKFAGTVPELHLPVMTFLGKADALVKLHRTPEAEELIASALDAAIKEGSLGYQAELTLRLGLIAAESKQTSRALETMSRAAELARHAGGNRILAGIDLERARVLRAENRLPEAEAVLREGVQASRAMGERLMLPRLLAQLADVHLSMGHRADTANLLQEADELLEGLLTKASSPWVRGRIIASMDDVVSARIRLEGERAGGNPERLYGIVERARARSLVDLLHSRPLSELPRPDELRAGERRIGALQLRLLRTTDRTQRQRLLDEIFVAEEQLAPVATELFIRSGHSARAAVSLRDLQNVLRPDEVVFEVALAEPASFAIVITRSSSRLKRLPGRAALLRQSQDLVSAIRDARTSSTEANILGTTLLSDIPELSSHRRLIVVTEGSLQQVPFELLPQGESGSRRLLETHVVSYTPSGSILAILRSRSLPVSGKRIVLAIGASPPVSATTPPTSARNDYDLDASKLAPLPLAAEEARTVAAAFGDRDSDVLVNDAATEAAVKAPTVSEYRVLHLAAHGMVSTKVPARSALVLRPSGVDDGLLQAREILNLRLNATLVTLSACDTSAGADQGQDGVASLVRPFVAAGARAVVANLWAADDAFSANLMRQFYQGLASGLDVGDALRRAKLKMIDLFGPEALPRLWSGVLAYGDASAIVVTPKPGTP